MPKCARLSWKIIKESAWFLTIVMTVKVKGQEPHAVLGASTMTDAIHVPFSAESDSGPR